MKKVTILLFFIAVFAMLLTGCVDSSTPDISDPADPNDSGTEEAVISVDYLTDEILNEYDSYDEFIEFEDEGYQKIILTASVAVKDFKYIEVGNKDGDSNIIFFEDEVLHSLKELLPEKPLVVTWMELGTIPHRGISFVDETNTAKYFCIAASGEDGSLFLVEFENE